MKSIFKRLIFLIWLVLFMTQACVLTDLVGRSKEVPEPDQLTRVVPEYTATVQPTIALSAAPTSDSTPEPEPVTCIDILPIDQGDGQVLLWAGGGVASSNAGTDRYHVRQALGKPDTLACGRFVTAWQPAPDETEAWIDLHFFPFILPNYLYILQSYQPKQIVKVEVVTLDEETITVFDGEEDEIYQPMECPAMRGLWLADVDTLISTVRITLQREADEDWTQIDAVGVLGLIGDGPTEPMEIVEWVDDEFGEFYGGFFTPRYYSNKNPINALTFAGEKLVSATDGGVVVWDTNTLSPIPYTAGQGLPTNQTTAIAYCDWEDDQVVVGGADGIALFAHDYFDIILDFDYDFFRTIEHPNDEYLGLVTALACDPQQEQIWVGFQGHLSRYDLRSQQWLEFDYETGMPFDVVRQIRIIDEEVWVATAYGVVVIQGDDVLTTYTPDNSEIPSGFVHAIVADEAGVKWMASSRGLIEFNGQEWRLWQSSEITGGSLGDILMGLDVDPSGNLWVVDTFGTMCQFSPTQKQCLNVIEPPDDLSGVTAFQVDGQGRMAMGDMKDGIQFVLEDEWFKLLTRDQLLENAIHAIAYAPDGNLWLATRAGVQYFKADQPASPWQKMLLPNLAQAHALFVASDGLWIGHTQGARFLPYLDQDMIDLPVGEPETGIANAVTAIVVDQDGLVYFGNYGVSIWDGSQFTYEDLLSPEEREKNTFPPQVRALYADGDVVWVGASNGLYQFQQGRLIESRVDALLGHSTGTRSVGVIMPVTDDEGLLVAIGRALYHFDNNAFERLLELDSGIRSLYVMPSALLLATANSGYYSLPKDGFGIYWDQVSEGVGFARHFGYQAITMSDTHTLWIASAEGGLQRTQALFGQ